MPNPNSMPWQYAPYADAAPVTPSDATVLQVTSAVFIGGAGNLSVQMSSGAIVTFTGVLAGTVLDINVTKIRATGTTATALIALY